MTVSTNLHDRFFKEVFSGRDVAQYLLGTDKISKKDLDKFLDQATDGRGGDIMPAIAETIFGACGRETMTNPAHSPNAAELRQRR
ncbi:MAG: hypothetical protein HQK60_16550 [Deltaproteobacteria bacterium]|nr:hypothetical protein [Deltaproteobacteria bacterium]